MNREIKFRGKRRYDGEWVYGGIEKEGDSYYIITEESAVCAEEGGEIVIQETIGQYTGLRDKNGVEIYEGDIVRLFCDCSGYYIEPRWVNAIIVWDEDLYGWEISFEHIRVGYSECIGNFKYDYDAQIEVIGNIFDNPELLEEDNA